MYGTDGLCILPKYEVHNGLALGAKAPNVGMHQCRVLLRQAGADICFDGTDNIVIAQQHRMRICHFYLALHWLGQGESFCALRPTHCAEPFDASI